MGHVAKLLGISTAETLRKWVRQVSATVESEARATVQIEVT